MTKPLFATLEEVAAHNARIHQQQRERRGLFTVQPCVVDIQTPVLLKESKRSFTLDLTWPPTLNNSGADSFRGGRKTREYKDFFEHTAMQVLAKRIKPLAGSLSVVIAAFPPDKRARDLDNLIKPILDAMQAAGCYANDKAFAHIEIARATESIGGMVLVTVREI